MKRDGFDLNKEIGETVRIGLTDPYNSFAIQAHDKTDASGLRGSCVLRNASRQLARAESYPVPESLNDQGGMEQ